MPATMPAPVRDGPKEPQEQVKRKGIVVRGFIRRAEDGSAYEGICLTLNLPARGNTLEETERKLQALIVAYLRDAVRDGTWDEFVPRRAPLSYYATYYWYNLLALRQGISDFKLFVESSPCLANA